MTGQNRRDNPDPYVCCDHLAGHAGPCEPSVTRTVRPDVLDRLMELWELPWSEERYGEAQMLLSKLRR